MLNNDRITLSNYRIEKAEECLKSATLLKDSGDYMSAANRSYYSIFHCIRAVMALDGEDRKKHSGVIAYFLENYIKIGVFDKKYSYIIKNAFQVRQESDYDDFCIISKEDISEQILNAYDLLEAVKKYISKNKWIIYVSKGVCLHIIENDQCEHAPIFVLLFY